jgi:hypothetical protein
MLQLPACTAAACCRAELGKAGVKAQPPKVVWVEF